MPFLNLIRSQSQPSGRLKACMQDLAKTMFVSGLILAGLAAPALAEPAPAVRAVVPADEAPEAMAKMFAKLGQGERSISVPGATWLQLQFAEVRLGPNGVLTITDASGQIQTFTQKQIDDWGGLSAVFNGSKVSISLKAGQGSSEPVSASIKNIIIGLPDSAVSDTEANTPRLMRSLLGPDLRRFIPADVLKFRRESRAARRRWARRWARNSLWLYR